MRCPSSKLPTTARIQARLIHRSLDPRIENRKGSKSNLAPTRHHPTNGLDSEPELGEEPPVLAGLEPLLEPLLGLLGGGDLLVLALEESTATASLRSTSRV